MIAALFTNGKLVTGYNHGDAYSKLSDQEKNTNISSGFYDEKTLKFISDQDEFYFKEIILIRHGECYSQDFNAEISEKGRSQAQKTATFLFNYGVNDFNCLCSPFSRCYETAEIISKICKIKIKKDLNLSLKTIEETENQFLQRIHGVLDILPQKTILISHCDFIKKMIQMTTGITENQIPQIISNCTITYINNHKPIWICKEI